LRWSSFDAEQLAIAQKAWLTFGRGRHAAKLNFGDCASYALAQSKGEPLLFVGGDFSRTDVRAAAYS
jgi:ribonuclease VapC